MSRYTTIEKWIDVEVDLEDFEDDDLIEELERRGKYNPSYGDSDDLIDKIYHARRQGKPYEHLLDELLYMKTGRAV
ncbi:MAG: hypothetical protein ACO29P_09270 [Bacteroidia bacterium]